MARSLDEVLGSLPPERRAAISARHAELRDEVGLAAIRRAAGKGQSEVADALGIKQPSVSKIERQADMNLSTLRDYVEALGGKLELVVHLPSGKEVSLQMLDALARVEALDVDVEQRSPRRRAKLGLPDGR